MQYMAHHSIFLCWRRPREYSLAMFYFVRNPVNFLLVNQHERRVTRRFVVDLGIQNLAKLLW